MPSASASTPTGLIHGAVVQAAPPVSAASTPIEPTLDRDALDALAWIERGTPDDQAGYGPDAPKLTQDQLAEVKRSAYAAPRSRKVTT